MEKTPQFYVINGPGIKYMLFALIVCKVVAKLIPKFCKAVLAPLVVHRVSLYAYFTTSGYSLKSLQQ